MRFKKDRAYKFIFRAARKYFKMQFKNSKFGQNLYRLNKDALVERSQEFLNHYYPILGADKENAQCFLLMVYSAKKNSKEYEEVIGKDNISVFTSVFGNNNSKRIRQNFFENEFVQKIWSLVASKLTYEFVF